MASQTLLSFSSIISETLTLSLGTDCLTLSVFSSARLVSCSHLYVCVSLLLAFRVTTEPTHQSSKTVESLVGSLLTAHMSPFSGHPRNSLLGEQQTLGGDSHGAGYLPLPGPKSTNGVCREKITYAQCTRCYGQIQGSGSRPVLQSRVVVSGASTACYQM